LRHRCATFGTAATVVSDGILDVGDVVALDLTSVIVVVWEFSVVEKIHGNCADEVLGIKKAWIGAMHTAAETAKTMFEVKIFMLNRCTGEAENPRRKV
jgi:hypothetical protein